VLVQAGNFTTNSGGDIGWVLNTAQLQPGQPVTAVAINTATGDTSEFSANRVVTQGP
jgi:hypothetical protein